MSTSRIKPNSDWRDGFLFLGNQLALDFLNTRPVQNGEPLELLPDFSATLRWFQAADMVSSRRAAELQHKWGESARSPKTVKAIHNLRERLRKEVLNWEASGALRSSTREELNLLMAEYPMRTRLAASAKKISTELYFDPQQPEHLFAPLAHSAALLFAHVDRTRVRKCGQCVLLFHDTSKKGTRRWCSMNLCGNRVKVAAYQRRQRSEVN